jgi:NAD(P)-dependent dehydrogenase (short-subunit alcohol dehydrogenase family)
MIPYMRAQRAGHLIQFSSVGGRIGALGRTAYSAAKWGVEGFSEAPCKRSVAAGYKGDDSGARWFPDRLRRWAKAEIPIRQEYQSTVGAAARFQAQYNGKQPGDPTRAARVIRTIAGLDAPPLRLMLGSDAVKAIEQSDLGKTEADKVWRQLSLSTDFPATEDSLGVCVPEQS